MEIASILSVVARRWIVTVIGAVLLVAVAVKVAPGPQRGATAESKLLLDTPASRAIDLGLEAEAIRSQAEILAGRMFHDTRRADIARAGGVATDQLDVFLETGAAPVRSSALGRSVAKVQSTPTLPYSVTVRIEPEVPIMTIHTTAPDTTTAAQLTQAASATLRAIAEQHAPSASRGLIVRPLGGVRTELVDAGKSGPVVLAAIVLALLLIWCSAVVIVPPLLRAVFIGGARPPAERA